MPEIGGRSVNPPGPIAPTSLEWPEHPRGLREFLSLQGGQALIIWRPTGTGKSTLSAALLKRFKGKLILVSSFGITPDALVGLSRDARVEEKLSFLLKSVHGSSPGDNSAHRRGSSIATRGMVKR